MGRNQYWAGRVYDLCVYYMTGTPEGSTESGFMEEPGIEPATPGLQGIALIHYTTWGGGGVVYHFIVPWKKTFVAFLVGLRKCVGFKSGTPKGSPRVFLWRSQESNLRPLVYKA